jgi:3-oxoacyl-[acyl-carrier-protein] synthase II
VALAALSHHLEAMPRDQLGGRNPSRHRVVITGVGAVTPLGVGARQLHDRWIAGRCGIEDGVGRCAEFDPADVMSSKDIRRSDRFTQLAVSAGAEALGDAGWSDELPYDPAQIGCVIGTGIGGLGSMEAGHDVLRDRGAERVSPLSVPLMMTNAAAGVLAMRHGLRGPTFSVGSACAAGTHAIGVATRMIQAGDAQAVVTGGAEATLTPLAMAAFAAMDATSTSGISRPFDARRDGFVMGEGAGVLVLEAAEFAVARGAHVLGEVLGYAATSDAHHLTAPDPHGRGAADAVRRALEDASVSAAEVDYVNAHGTSTPLNDRAETAALKSALGQHAWRIPVSSTKSATGHLLGAAGAVEAIATALALSAHVAPPTLGYEQPDEGMDLDYVPDAARPLEVRTNGHGARSPIALSNSFGFGGHNAVLCLRGAA